MRELFRGLSGEVFGGRTDVTGDTWLESAED